MNNISFGSTVKPTVPLRTVFNAADSYGDTYYSPEQKKFIGDLFTSILNDGRSDVVEIVTTKPEGPVRHRKVLVNGETICQNEYKVSRQSFKDRANDIYALLVMFNDKMKYVAPKKDIRALSDIIFKDSNISCTNDID